MLLRKNVEMLFKNNKKSYVVYTAGAAVLKEIAKPVAVVSDEIRNIAAEMLVAMRIFNGIGLAAPQYGYSLRMVVFDVPSESNTGTPGEIALLPRMPMTVINPEIIAYSSSKTEREEGCLSVPEIYAPVIRPERVVFRAQTLAGEFIEYECGGLLGRCIQHELDHLDGKLFTDRLTADAARQIRGDLERLKRIGQSSNYRRISKK
ncbi:MAG: peptide deformylase [Lentisphaeria bacterium]|nr:peptide deformylase [Lentisphaeria bacterium]